MEAISAFDIFKIGVGPSSSHTMGPWRAAQTFLEHCHREGVLDQVTRVRCDLYGSLAKTGRGHGTDFAVILGLSGKDPVTCDPNELPSLVSRVRTTKMLPLAGGRSLRFDPETDLIFNPTITHASHPNALKFTATLAGREPVVETYFSIGGGFITQDGPASGNRATVTVPYPLERGQDLLEVCAKLGKTIPEVILLNERAWRAEPQVRADLLTIWRTMQECIYRGCHTDGTLPGGLNVIRRAAGMNRNLISATGTRTLEDWRQAVKASGNDFQRTLKWVSCFALAVNEENASFGRVVTAPTNGAAGVIPAVLLYLDLFCNRPADSDQHIIDFMLTAAEMGSLFKKGATISAAMGGCQAEIGVSSAMAAAGLTQVLGGSPGQVLMAAEIAMEHHLGMTCDPIKGLVQIPCIERNTMGAIKAITASTIALEGNPANARVTLDGVIKTMWETARDMGSKYKETSEGGLAVYISVGLTEC